MIWLFSWRIGRNRAAKSGKPGSGIICLNGAAARLVSEGDLVIIMSYAQMTREELKEHKPTVVFVDPDTNAVTSVEHQEVHGEIR